MSTYTITFQSRETLPDRLEAIARELDLTPEQLIKRFIGDGMAKLDGNDGPSAPGETLEDFLVKNEVWKPESSQ
jgi:hypothetical protein